MLLLSVKKMFWKVHILFLSNNIVLIKLNLSYTLPAKFVSFFYFFTTFRTIFHFVTVPYYSV